MNFKKNFFKYYVSSDLGQILYINTKEYFWLAFVFFCSREKEEKKTFKTLIQKLKKKNVNFNFIIIIKQQQH